MTASTSTETFLDLVRKSGAVDPRRLDTFMARQPSPPDDPKALADLLIQNGLITKYHAEPLLKGKLQRFLLSSKYRVLDRLGAGGMASVFLCEHKVMRRRVAIKVLPPNLANNASAVDRFHREARAAASLHHPNIVGAHDVDVDGNFHFLVTEYVEGRNLHEMIRLNGTLSPERAAHYISQAALGLQHAHERGMVHRDIKPANLLLDRTGTVKLLDMGLALLFHEEDDGLTKEHDASSILGTAEFLAPEQAMDSHAVDIRADIYSLGMTLYFLLTGKTPFSEGGTTAQKIIWHQIRPPKPVTEYRPDVPEELSEVIDRMLAKSPDDRPQTPMDVAIALQPWTSQPIAPPAESEMPKPMVPLSTDGPSSTDGQGSSSSSYVSMPAINLPSTLDAATSSGGLKSAAPVTRAAPVSKGRLTPPPASARKVIAEPASPTKGPSAHTISDPPRAAVKARAADADSGSLSDIRKRKKKKDEPKKSQKAKIAAMGVGGGLLCLLIVGVLAIVMSGSDDPEVTSTRPIVKLDPTPSVNRGTNNNKTNNNNKGNNNKGGNNGKTGNNNPKPTKPDPTKPKPPPTEPKPPPTQPKPPPTTPPEPKPAVTAEFLPLAERELEYDVYVYVPQQAGWGYTREKYEVKPDGDVQITKVMTGTNLVANTAQVPSLRQVSNARPTPQKLRVSDGKIEIVTLVNVRTKEFAYEPVLKLGANLGDTWEYTLPTGDIKQYEVTAFGEWGEDRVPTVTVRSRQPYSAGGNGAEMVTTYVYANKIGEVERSVKIVGKDNDGAEVSIPQVYVQLRE